MRPPSVPAAFCVAALLACSSASQVAKAPMPVNPNEVIITNYKFVPQTLTITVGGTVKWLNRDIAQHTATHISYGDDAFDTGFLGHLAAFSQTFRTAGSYDYLCALHQGMTGTIVVE